jgi:hypothetical protein
MNYVRKRPRKRYKDYRKFKEWSKKAMDREEWASVIKEAKAFRVPENQGISRKVMFLHIKNLYPLYFFIFVPDYVFMEKPKPAARIGQ